MSAEAITYTTITCERPNCDWSKEVEDDEDEIKWHRIEHEEDHAISDAGLDVDVEQTDDEAATPLTDRQTSPVSVIFDPSRVRTKSSATAAEEPVRVGDGRGKPRWTREKVIAAIKAWGHEHGRAPMLRDTKGDSTLPSPATVANYCGSWANAVEAAGFDRPERGKPRRRAGTPGAHRTEKWIRINGTGLAYRTVEDALEAADEIEADGERVSHQARVDGNEAKADEAIDRARGLAERIRVIARGGMPPEPAPPVRDLTDHSFTDLAIAISLARDKYHSLLREMQKRIEGELGAEL